MAIHDFEIACLESLKKKTDVVIQGSVLAKLDFSGNKVRRDCVVFFVTRERIEAPFKAKYILRYSRGVRRSYSASSRYHLPIRC